MIGLSQGTIAYPLMVRDIYRILTKFCIIKLSILNMINLPKTNSNTMNEFDVIVDNRIVWRAINLSYLNYLKIILVVIVTCTNTNTHTFAHV